MSDILITMSADHECKTGASSLYDVSCTLLVAIKHIFM